MKLWYGILAAVVLGLWASQERIEDLVDRALLKALGDDGWMRDWVN